MALTIMRRIKFCAGHRLHRHGGKCEFFHGHNYTADFYVTAQETDEVGRVIDFADLKRLFKGWLDEHWDHGFVLNESDENGIRVIKQVDVVRMELSHSTDQFFYIPEPGADWAAVALHDRKLELSQVAAPL